MKNTNIRISGMLFCYCWPCPTIAVQLHYNTKDHSIEWPFFKFAIDLANIMLYNCGRSTIKWGLGYEKNIIVFSFMFLLYPFI